MCVAVRLNMSLASLCSHIHKSTYNDCKPKTQHPEKSTALYLTALWASHQQVSLQPAPHSISIPDSKPMHVLHYVHCKIKITINLCSDQVSAVLLLRNGLMKCAKKKKKLSSSHLSHIRPVMRKTLPRLIAVRSKMLTVLWLNTEIDNLNHVITAWQETRHFYRNQDICLTEMLQYHAV